MSKSAWKNCISGLRPQLEILEERALLSATPALDLTTRGSEGWVSEALFRQTDAQPTGTGVINSFVRLQSRGSATTEQGYNTDARPLELDENSSPNFTRSIRLSEVPQATFGGKVYLEFLLDINQNASRPLLSLDQLRLYAADERDLKGYDSGAKTLAGHEAFFDLGAENWVKLNYKLNHGSGSGDVLVYVPVPESVRTGNPYIYLYSSFGTNIAANAGFEEWAVHGDRPASLSGFVYNDANDDGVFDATEGGIAGVTIILTGVDKFGHSVDISVTTDENGFYSFSGLQEGTYRLREIQPEGVADGKDSIGTQGGTVVDNDGLGDEFADIHLAVGVIGLFNNFGEHAFFE